MHENVLSYLGVLKLAEGVHKLGVSFSCDVKCLEVLVRILDALLIVRRGVGVFVLAAL